MKGAGGSGSAGRKVVDPKEDTDEKEELRCMEEDRDMLSQSPLK